MKTLLGTLLVTSLLVLSPASQAAEMNINTATAAQLTELKGIGGKKAQAIIEWRKANGPFTDVAQLTEIKGIGPNTLKRMNTTLTLGDTDKMAPAIDKKSHSIDKTTTGKVLDSHQDGESLETASNDS